MLQGIKVYYNQNTSYKYYTYNKHYAFYTERGYSMYDLRVIRDSGELVPREITEDLYYRFIAFIDAKPKSIETYTRALRQFFNYLSFKGISRPQRTDILNFRDEIKKDHKPTTVQNYIVAVRLFFSWTEQEGLYPNVADHVKGAKLNREHKKDYLTSTQAKAILESVERDNLKGLRDYAILTLMFTGGLRTIEVSRADISDLRVVGDTTVLFVQGKGKEEKTDFVKIPFQVEKAIRDYLKVRKTSDVNEPLFSSTSNNNYGRRLSTRSISGMVKQRLKMAGYNSDRLSAHSFRHTAVTLSLLGGQSLQEVQQFARHVNITTTQIYAHNLERAQSKCEEVIAGAIF